MGDNGRAMLEKATQFKRLDRKRSEIGLDPIEEARWRQLKHEMSQKLFGGKDDFKNEDARRDLRVPLRMEVGFRSQSDFQRAYIANISGGGLYVETDAVLDLGAKVNVQLGVGKHNISVPGEVVWVNSNPAKASYLKRGVGLKFGELSKEASEIIRDLVHKQIDNKILQTTPINSGKAVGGKSS